MDVEFICLFGGSDDTALLLLLLSKLGFVGILDTVPIVCSDSGAIGLAVLSDLGRR
jgi:hypothetical protein